MKFIVKRTNGGYLYLGHNEYYKFLNEAKIFNHLGQAVVALNKAVLEGRDTCYIVGVEYSLREVEYDGETLA